MKLKEYQERTLTEVKRFLEQLAAWRAKARVGEEWLDFVEMAWKKASVSRTYLKKEDGLGRPLPSFCLKIRAAMERRDDLEEKARAYEANTNVNIRPICLVQVERTGNGRASGAGCHRPCRCRRATHRTARAFQGGRDEYGAARVPDSRRQGLAIGQL